MGLRCHQPSVPLKSKIVVSSEEKQRGVHVFGRIDSMGLVELEALNAEWITLVPYAGQTDVDSPEVRFSRSNDPERMKRQNERWISAITRAHDAGFNVFLKPHIWIRNPSDGKWRSDIYFEDEEEWNTWKTSYKNFILHYAKMAQEANVEMFCIGTEFTKLSMEKPDFWREIIKEVKLVYSGKLTYAANWYEEYESVSFWEELDFIGIQAYFPISKNNTPSVSDLNEAWKSKIDHFVQQSELYEKPILFTELGYKSTTDATVTPWEWVDYMNDSKYELSYETQVNAYTALFETIWDEDWFAGIHLWQWRTDGRERGDRHKIDFSPKGKPAEAIITEGFNQ